MNPLAQRLPTGIRVAGTAYPVNSHWRNCLKILLAFESDELTQWEKLEIMARLLYKKTPPLCGETFEKAVRFLNCGGDDTGAFSKESGEAGERLYSFGRDGRFIYPAFRQSHGIDLATAELHWWEFCWLFLDLREDCAFCRLVGLRSRRLRGTLSREEREQLAGMEGLLAEPEQKYTSQEQVQLESFMRSMGANTD